MENDRSTVAQAWAIFVNVVVAATVLTTPGGCSVLGDDTPDGEIEFSVSSTQVCEDFDLSATVTDANGLAGADLYLSSERIRQFSLEGTTAQIHFDTLFMETGERQWRLNLVDQEGDQTVKSHSTFIKSNPVCDFFPLKDGNRWSFDYQFLEYSADSVAGQITWEIIVGVSSGNEMQYLTRESFSGVIFQPDYSSNTWMSPEPLSWSRTFEIVETNAGVSFKYPSPIEPWYPWIRPPDTFGGVLIPRYHLTDHETVATFGRWLVGSESYDYAWSIHRGAGLDSLYVTYSPKNGSNVWYLTQGSFSPGPS